jgi:hypothetical protein
MRSQNRQIIGRISGKGAPQGSRTTLLLFGLAAFMAFQTTNASAQECRFLAGEARRYCNHAEAAARSEENRERADIQRQDRVNAYRERAPQNYQSPYSARANNPAPDYAAQRAAQQAQLEQQREAEAARIAALPDASPKLSKKLETIVEADSKGWGFNTFDRGSVQNVKIEDSAGGGKSVVLRGDYTYNNGTHGWVEAKISRGTVECVHFWDDSACHGVRTVADAQMKQGLAGALMGSMVSGGGGGGSGGSSDTDSGMQQAIQRQNQENNEQYEQNLQDAYSGK